MWRNQDGQEAIVWGSGHGQWFEGWVDLTKRRGKSLTAIGNRLCKAPVAWGSVMRLWDEASMAGVQGERLEVRLAQGTLLRSWVLARAAVDGCSEVRSSEGGSGSYKWARPALSRTSRSIPSMERSVSSRISPFFLLANHTGLYMSCVCPCLNSPCLLTRRMTGALPTTVDQRSRPGARACRRAVAVVWFTRLVYHTSPRDPSSAQPAFSVPRWNIQANKQVGSCLEILFVTTEACSFI